MRARWAGGYPRVCGDDVRDGEREGSGVGATPACAGTTVPRQAHRPDTRGYPRVCGDDGNVTPEDGMVMGLPPRVRGRRRRYDRLARPHRATPACAGTTSPSGSASPRTPGYPRVCGDDFSSTAAARRMTGLPPRVRGRLHGIAGSDTGWGATPACAGTTPRHQSHRPRTPGYPRVCGDDLESVQEPVGCFGLPPRVRGRPASSRDGNGSTRATPACAGTTRWLTAVRVAHEGLPPRVRGRLGFYPLVMVALRATPACAGTTRYAARKKAS